jgi:hypothetical protein
MTHSDHILVLPHPPNGERLIGLKQSHKPLPPWLEGRSKVLAELVVIYVISAVIQKYLNWTRTTLTPLKIRKRNGSLTRRLTNSWVVALTLAVERRGAGGTDATREKMTPF